MNALTTSTPSSFPHRPAAAARAFAGPALLLDGRGRLLGGNLAGLEQFCAHLGAIQADRAAFHDAENAAALAAARRRLVQGGLASIVVRFESLSGALLFAMLFAECDEEAEGRAFLLLLPHLNAPPALAACLMSSFGLTPAEVRLALTLNEGLALAEAAAALDVSVNTARNQLRAVFDKLGLRRQAELLRAMAQLAALDPGVAVGEAAGSFR